MTQPHASVINAAMQAAYRSPCLSQRGAVIFSGGDIVARAWNDQPKGFLCAKNAECKATCRRTAVHAEQQAILYAGPYAMDRDMLHVKVHGDLIVPSGKPSCLECSKLMVAAGIRGMWLYHGHDTGWQRYPIDLFHTLTIAHDPSLGIMIDQRTRCASCGGSGRKFVGYPHYDDDPCRVCSGTGVQ